MSNSPSLSTVELMLACQADLAEMSPAFSRALDRTIEVSLGQMRTWEELAAAHAASLEGPGLAITLHVQGHAAVVLLPESSGLVPATHATSDAASAAQLSALAHELGPLVLPATHAPDDFKAHWIRDLAAGLKRGGLDANAIAGELLLKSGDELATALVLWPLTQPGRMFLHSGAAAVIPAAKLRPLGPANATDKRAASDAERAERLRELPPYTRSLLHIKVPVMVTLAAKRQTLGHIIELGPGSIIQFTKPCDEMLDLCVGEHRVAQGEAVKVGDKFGLRIMAISPPPATFETVRGTA